MPPSLKLLGELKRQRVCLVSKLLAELLRTLGSKGSDKVLPAGCLSWSGRGQTAAQLW